MIHHARLTLRRSTRVLCAILFALAMAGVAAAQPTPASAPSPDGKEIEVRKPTSSWSGVIHLPGEPLEVTVHFDMPIDGAAMMEIPAQGMKGEHLSHVERGEGFMRFQWRAMGRAGGSATFDLVVDASGAAAEGEMKQFGQAFKVTLKRTHEAPAQDPDAAPAARPQMPQEPFLYTIRPVSFTSAADGVRISGTLTIPGLPPPGAVFDDVRHPAVIIVGGASARDRDGTIEGHKPWWVLADHLAMHGIATLRVDDRGVGASTGDKAQASVSDLVADVRAAAGILRVQPDIDAGRIVLIGFGEGATIAARACAEMREALATILITTRLTPSDAMANPPKEAPAPASATKPALNLRGGGEHRATYWDQHDNESDHALMKREGADPVEVRILENLNASMQTLDQGGDPSNVGVIEETFAPIALDAITQWLAERFGQN